VDNRRRIRAILTKFNLVGRVLGQQSPCQPAIDGRIVDDQNLRHIYTSNSSDVAPTLRTRRLTIVISFPFALWRTSSMQARISTKPRPQPPSKADASTFWGMVETSNPGPSSRTTNRASSGRIVM